MNQNMRFVCSVRLPVIPDIPHSTAYVSSVGRVERCVATVTETSRHQEQTADHGWCFHIDAPLGPRRSLGRHRCAQSHRGAGVHRRIVPCSFSLFLSPAARAASNNSHTSRTPWVSSSWRKGAVSVIRRGAVGNAHALSRTRWRWQSRCPVRPQRVASDR